MSKNPPSGMSMMLKALGLEIDPDMIKKVAESVMEIRDRLQRIEDKLDRIIGERMVFTEIEAKVKENQNGDGR